MMRAAIRRASFLIAFVAAQHANATGFTDIGQDHKPTETFQFEWHGYLRTRAEAFYNLDLDRGPLPSGVPLFPVSLSNPRAQWLSNADMRWRNDIAVYAPWGGVAVKARLDVLDNLSLGSMPEGIPYASLTQRPSGTPITLRRAYGEAVLPFGYVTAGRMGSHWGLGMLTNGGDCIDCETGDAVDRVAFSTPLAGHVFAVAYDFSATLALAPRPNDRAVVFEPSANVRSITFAMLRFFDPDARIRRRKANRTSIEYGAFFSHRWQDEDIPSAYVSSDRPVAITGGQVMGRGAKFYAIDGWFRFAHPKARLEIEAAFLGGRVEQASLVPGILLRDPVDSAQLGLAFESDFGDPDGRFTGGLDAGYASGDRGGILGALQAPPPNNRVDTFRFHPDYHVDRILFREIVGAVTNAVYLRPHANLVAYKLPTGTLAVPLSIVASFAAAPKSSPSSEGAIAPSRSPPPSGDVPLGVEVDPSLIYQSRDGFFAALDYGALFPLSGMDGIPLKAQPAQSLRARLAFRF